MDVASIAGHGLDVLALLFLPPLLLGFINRTKAAFAGRQGPPLLQVYWDLGRLLKKQMVISSTTTWVFRVAPMVIVLSSVFAGLLMPLGFNSAAWGFEGDLILFIYFLALGRFFMVAAALDTGSSFEGMGAAREVTYACLAEPAVFFALLCLVRLSGSLSMATMLMAPSGRYEATLLLCVVGLFIVLLLECSRVPFDDPNTHLELTMIHEVMVLDHSGPLFAAILYGAAMKLFIFGVLIVRLLLPVSDAPLLGRLQVVAGLLALSILVGVLESITGRIRLRKIPHLVAGAVFLTAFGFLLMVN